MHFQKSKKKATLPGGKAGAHTAFAALTAKPSDGGRVLRNGAFATAITAAVLAVVVLINLFARAVPTKYTQFDLSTAGIYTLDDTTRTLLDSLGQDVEIFYLAQTGGEDPFLPGLLNRYADASTHVTWQQKDPAIYPTFASGFGAQNASEGSVIVTSGERSAVIDAADLYQYDYSEYYTNGSYDVSFDGENQLTAAIYDVTSGKKSHAYYLTNHGEIALSDALTSAVEKQNITLTALSLLSEPIPDDCDLLIINGPTSDFSGAGALVDEAGELAAYLAQGGKLMMLTDAQYDTPNLDAVLADYGLARKEGLVVEGDSDYSMRDYSYYLLPEYADTEECTALSGLSGQYVILPLAQALQTEELDNVIAEPLLITSPSAYIKAEGYGMTDAAKAEGDETGTFALAVWANDIANNAEIIWVGCSNMTDGGVDSYVSGGNSAFLLACAAYLSGQDASILVASKALTADTVTVGTATLGVLGFVFILAIPAALLISGGVIVLRRRRR